MPAEGFKGHVATDGSLLGTAGKWEACGQWRNWMMMKNWDLLHGMCGSMEAELEVQRTTKRAELTAFPCLLKKVMGPSKVHVNNKGIIDGRWRGERECIKPKAGDADFVDQDLGKNCTVWPQEIWRWKWSMSRHTAQKKEKKEMSHFDKKFVNDGNEKPDELAKAGAMLDKGFMAEERAKTMQQEVYAALQYAASFYCLVEEWKDCDELKPMPKEKLIFVDHKKEDTKHRTEWCAEAEKYRCSVVWKRQQVHEDARKMHRTKEPVTNFGKMEKATSWEPRFGKKSGQTG